MASMSTTTFPSSACSFTNQGRRRRRSNSLPLKRTHLLPRILSCKAHDENKQHHSESSTNDSQDALKLDRRNMLMALGGAGLYGATATGQSATANPIQPPDVSQCQPATGGGNPINCCPPSSSNTIIDFQLPSPSSPLRIRPAAHLVDNAYIQKYRTAVQLMRALPANDPRNFMQQANVHCAYCDGAYDQLGFPNLELQIHNCWLFFPWHRFYLYFHERILAKLINDPTFALPYWNWDAPAGMRMPSIYATPTTSNSLYDALRDAAHQPPALIDLDYNLTDENIPEQDQIDQNLTIMYRQVVTNNTAQLFMGSPYRAGDAPNPGAGSMENVPHGPVHIWTGDRTQPNLEDMGTFYSAGRDPIFFAHHGNIDRMWYLWQKYVAKKTQNFNDTDWLDAAFLFYDENARPVRVRVRDGLDNRLLRYTYQDVDIPWLTKRPTPKASSAAARASFTEATFPINLTAAASVTVNRPRVGRSQAEKAAETEMLVVDGIHLERDKPIKFDVYVNAPQYEGIRADASEFVGSFVNVPHTHGASDGQGVNMRTTLRLSITEPLEDLGVDGERNIVVTLVPRMGSVVIDAIRVEYSAS
ncbi:hypothetical protein J5N97_016610 [Dioscorea zingiberensis]|uniref:Tyrosinase copper-binding domain-containing protein n=1 Tax=Dioscorea zingiberensis TaxID=325984 RepID=A0A9D5CKA6_9LILI|nr:hypothetical protein J5N97_016610 [Dioscorea zingiberensis]